MSYDTKVGTTTVTVWHRTDTVGGFKGWSESENPRLTLAYAYEIDPATMREELPHVSTTVLPANHLSCREFTELAAFR